MVQFCQVTTEDGLRLDGALMDPQGSPAIPGVDAFLLVHGTGASFYSGGVLQRFAEQAASAGVAVLRANTRGHDLVANIPTLRGSVRGGAAFEDIGDAGKDILAWVTFLQERGFRNVLLAGHSMGGVKCLLAMSEDLPWNRPPAGIVGLSPPRFCHANLADAPGSQPFRTDFEKAKSLVAAGQAETLIEVTQPLPLVMTAGGYCRKYGPEDRFDYVPRLARVPRPVLILIGTGSIESSPAFHGLPEAIGRLGLSQVEVQTVDGANIGYGQCPDEPFRRTREWWMRRTGSA